MTNVAVVYAQALYDLVKDEGCSEPVLKELSALSESFAQEKNFVRLLSAPNLTKEERCRILDDSFRGKVNPYVLNFLKILTEKGYIRQFPECCDAYRGFYNEDNGILVVKAVSAVALKAEQTEKLTAKLHQLTGKEIQLLGRIDPAILGGIRLDYDGKRLEDTVAHRLDSIRDMLKNTVL